MWTAWNCGGTHAVNSGLGGCGRCFSLSVPHLLKGFNLLAALWRLPLEHVAVVGFGRGGKLGQWGAASTVCQQRHTMIHSVPTSEYTLFYPLQYFVRNLNLGSTVCCTVQKAHILTKSFQTSHAAHQRDSIFYISNMLVLLGRNQLFCIHVFLTYSLISINMN